jgi:putative RecB family exonuclease
MGHHPSRDGYTISPRQRARRVKENMFERVPYPEHVSYSQIHEYAECPYRFLLSRGYKVPVKPAIWFLGGSAFHALTEGEDLVREGQTWDGPTTWAEAWEEQAEENLRKYPDVPLEDYRRGGRVSKQNPNKEDKAFWDREGPKMIDGYRRWRDIIPWTVPTLGGQLAIEWDITIEWDDGTKLVGAADRLFEDPRTGMLIVADLKSGATIPKIPDQLGTYAAAVSQILGREVTWGTFYNARKAHHEPFIPLLPYTPARLKYETQTFEALRDSEVYLPNRGEHCLYRCDVSAFCVFANGTRANEVPLPYPADSGRR